MPDTGRRRPDREVTKIFCCDLLSIAMSKAPAGCVWVTVMGNRNTPCRGFLAEAACIVLAEGVSLDEGTLAKAGKKASRYSPPNFRYSISRWRSMRRAAYDPALLRSAHPFLPVPCGDDDMTPANLVGMAAVKGLDVIALTDHNTCKNCPAAMHHGAEYGVTVIPGMELTTEEEIHVICLFPSLQDALSFDSLIGSKLMPFPNREDIFGKQQIMNEKDEVTGTVENLLINAVSVSLTMCFASCRNITESPIPPTSTKRPPA